MLSYSMIWLLVCPKCFTLDIENTFSLRKHSDVGNDYAKRKGESHGPGTLAGDENADIIAEDRTAKIRVFFL